jgi:cytochrome P450
MTLLHVISNPPVCRKLQHEIDTAIASGAISSPIKDSEARRLPYLQAVIREGIRIFPGATPPLFKTVPEGGDVIEGHTLPAGTQVGVNIFGIMRDKRIWGADADLFRPERWTEADEKRLERMGTVLEVHFGFGRFKCLGRPIVFLELNKIIPEVSLPSSAGMPLRVIWKDRSMLTRRHVVAAPSTIRSGYHQRVVAAEDHQCWVLSYDRYVDAHHEA